MPSRCDNFAVLEIYRIKRQSCLVVAMKQNPFPEYFYALEVTHKLIFITTRVQHHTPLANIIL